MVVVFFLLSLMGGAAYWGGKKVDSSWLAKLPLTVQSVRVEGQRYLSEQWVKKEVGVQEGDALYGPWLDRALAKLHDHPRLSSVRIYRSVNGVVRIQIQERHPAAMALFDSFYLIDGRGNLLEKISIQNADASKFVIFTGGWGGTEPSEKYQENLSAGLSLLSALTQAGIADTGISELHLDDELGWLVFRNGWRSRIVFGKSQFPDKARRLAKILDDFKHQQGAFREIDLDFRDRAIVKLRKGLNVRGEVRWQKKKIWS